MKRRVSSTTVSLSLSNLVVDKIEELRGDSTRSSYINQLIVKQLQAEGKIPVEAQ